RQTIKRFTLLPSGGSTNEEKLLRSPEGQAFSPQAEPSATFFVRRACRFRFLPGVARSLVSSVGAEQWKAAPFATSSCASAGDGSKVAVVIRAMTAATSAR